MDGVLNTILVISLVIVTALTVAFFVLLIQILSKLKRILTKVEIHIDNIGLTQEEIKLKILNFIEEILKKIKSYGKMDLLKHEADKSKNVRSGKGMSKDEKKD